MDSFLNIENLPLLIKKKRSWFSPFSQSKNQFVANSTLSKFNPIPTYFHIQVNTSITSAVTKTSANLIVFNPDHSF